MNEFFDDKNSVENQNELRRLTELNEMLPQKIYLIPVYRELGLRTYRDLLSFNMHKMWRNPRYPRVILEDLSMLKRAAHHRQVLLAMVEGNPIMRGPDDPPLPFEEVPPADSLDDTIPRISVIGPFLKRNGIRTYRDALGIDLETFRGRRGFGYRKMQQLERVVNEAKRLDAQGEAASAPRIDGSALEAERERRVRSDDDGTLDAPLPRDRSMGPLYDRIRAETYRDLFRIDLDKVARLRGMGPIKTERLFDLYKEAKRREMREEEEARAERVARYADRDPRVVLGLFSKRLENIIDRHQLNTIAVLREWHASVKISEVENYGRGTHQELGDLLARLDAQGHIQLVFGEELPGSAAELAETFIKRLGEREREIFKLRFIEGKTLREIGHIEEVTHERIRQIIEREFDRHRPSWGARARALLKPARDLLEDRGGIASGELILDYLADPEFWALELTAELAGSPIRTLFDGAIITIIPPDEFEKLRDEMRQDIASSESSLDAELVRAILGGYGIEAELEEIAKISEPLIGVIIEGEHAFPRSQSTRAAYLNVLKDAGGPLTAEEVARRVNEISPEYAANKRNAVAHFRRVDYVYSYDTGRWIHQANLPLSREELHALAERSLPRVEAANGEAVSARKLRDELVARGEAPEELTANLLRDALLATGKARGWPAGVEVAWLGGEISTRTIAEWIEAVALELDQPFSASELSQVIASRSGHLPASIYTAISGHDSLLRVGYGRYISIAAIFRSEDEYRAALEAVEAALSAGWLVSATDPELEIPGMPPLDQSYLEHRGAIIWGLASRCAESLVTKDRGLLIWPKRAGKTLWSVLDKRIFGEKKLFTIAELVGLLESAGLRERQHVHGYIQEGVLRDYIVRIGEGTYRSAHMSFAEQRAFLNEHEESAEDALDGKAHVEHLLDMFTDLLPDRPRRRRMNDYDEEGETFWKD